MEGQRQWSEMQSGVLQEIIKLPAQSYDCLPLWTHRYGLSSASCPSIILVIYDPLLGEQHAPRLRDCTHRTKRCRVV